MPRFDSPSHYTVLGLVAGAMTGVDFLATLSVNFSEASIRGGIGASPDAFLWVLSVYAGAGAAAILLLERLARRFRYRALLLSFLALFIVGSLLAACSHSLSALIAARLLQGLGGGPLMTCSRVFLQSMVPPKSRGLALRGFMYGIFASSAPAPWLAARLLQDSDWHAVFLMQAAFAALVWLAGWRVLPHGRHRARPLGHLDAVAALSFCLATLLALHILQDLRYQRPDAAFAGRVALVLLLCTCVWRHLLRHADPWFDWRRVASRRYLTGLMFYTFYYLINGALAMVAPMYLLSGEAFDLDVAGWVQSTAGVGTLLLLPFYFRAASRLGDRRHVMAVGFVLMAGCLLWLGATVTGTTPWQRLLPIFALKSVFPVLVVIQVAGLTFREFDAPDFAHAYAMKNILRLMANAVGAGIANVYWQDIAAQGRTRLVSRLGLGDAPDYAAVQAAGPDALARLSLLVDRQAALLAAHQVFTLLAMGCLVGGVVVLCQRSLR
ncbi:MFS transporter [Paludibacterium yongneupense]|uniref:MFS transporter n=1 Tax=Paludibacterium yongneupense TaxID=400061 RepID=UPI0004218941|nr:MFS transporter [Paludibacterium yongneupense]